MHPGVAQLDVVDLVGHRDVEQIAEALTARDAVLSDAFVLDQQRHAHEGGKKRLEGAMRVRLLHWRRPSGREVVPVRRLDPVGSSNVLSSSKSVVGLICCHGAVGSKGKNLQLARPLSTRGTTTVATRCTRTRARCDTCPTPRCTCRRTPSPCCTPCSTRRSRRCAPRYRLGWRP